MSRKIPWIRLLLAALFFAAAFWNAGKAVDAKMQFESAFASVICLLIAAILLGSTLIRQASQPFTGLIDRVYFGSNHQDDVPPINVRLPRAYRAERCYWKSVEECERQLQWHPLAPELWAELVLAHRGSGNPLTAATARQRALECLGMSQAPDRFDRILKDRDNLPDFPAGLTSQFER